MLSNDPKPIWLVEIMANDHQLHGFNVNPNFKETFEIFFNNGYQGFIADHEMCAITMENVELVLKGQREFDTHNFLFHASKKEQ